MTTSTVDNTAPALPRRRDWHEFHLPIYWSRLAQLPEGTTKPTFSEMPLDLSVPNSVPDGQYPVANGNARSVDHLATVEDGLLDLASTAHACYEAIWRAHGLVPELPSALNRPRLLRGYLARPRPGTRTPLAPLGRRPLPRLRRGGRVRPR